MTNVPRDWEIDIETVSKGQKYQMANIEYHKQVSESRKRSG